MRIQLPKAAKIIAISGINGGLAAVALGLGLLGKSSVAGYYGATDEFCRKFYTKLVPGVRSPTFLWKDETSKKFTAREKPAPPLREDPELVHTSMLEGFPSGSSVRVGTLDLPDAKVVGQAWSGVQEISFRKNPEEFLRETFSFPLKVKNFGSYGKDAVIEREGDALFVAGNPPMPFGDWLKENRPNGQIKVTFEVGGKDVALRFNVVNGEERLIMNGSVDDIRGNGVPRPTADGFQEQFPHDLQDLSRGQTVVRIDGEEYLVRGYDPETGKVVVEQEVFLIEEGAPIIVAKEIKDKITLRQLFKESTPRVKLGYGGEYYVDVANSNEKMLRVWQWRGGSRDRYKDYTDIPISLSDDLYFPGVRLTAKELEGKDTVTIGGTTYEVRSVGEHGQGKVFLRRANRVEMSWDQFEAAMRNPTNRVESPPAPPPRRRHRLRKKRILLCEVPALAKIRKLARTNKIRRQGKREARERYGGAPRRFLRNEDRYEYL